MLKRKILWLFFIAFGTILYTSCKKFTVEKLDSGSVPALPSVPYEYLNVNTPKGTVDLLSLVVRTSGFHNPTTFPNFSSDPGLTNISNASVTLGRVLFYDKRLSINNSVACASCHDQSKAFSDGLNGSAGFADKITPRNSMAIINPIAMGNLFWDSRAGSAFDLSLRPVFNHIEMGMESDEALVKKIAAAPFYAELFKSAFGDDYVDRDRIAQAISHFLNAMVTVNSKFDVGETNNFSNFDAMEKLGKDLFFSTRLNCTNCHDGSNFSAPTSHTSAYSQPTVKGTANIGLDLNYKDNGKGNGKFRIPSLRNIELTAPYMHDGRFITLEEVVEHYNSGVKAHAFLDENLTENGLPRRLNLTSIEKAALVAFLKTLTDQSYTTDIKYSNPFKS